MKNTRLLLLVLLSAIGLAAATHDYFLLPENFFIHKGDKLDLHLLEGDLFVKQNEVKYQPAKTTKFMLFAGSKKVDLTTIAKEDNAPLIDYPIEYNGQSLVELTTASTVNDVSRDSYSDFLNNEGYDKLAETVKNSNQFRVKEKNTRYLKTLLSVENHDGNAYEKVMNDDFEIILKDNPYDKKYGDDMAALVRFKGKPIKGATISLYIKAITGNVYTQKMLTDDKGMIAFTMTREGIYLLRGIIIEPTKDKDADYESWRASYTFPFSSSDDVPNTYKEFGFGNKH
jgi:uncharacterized GH25 family protein